MDTLIWVKFSFRNTTHSDIIGRIYSRSTEKFAEYLKEQNIDPRRCVIFTSELLNKLKEIIENTDSGGYLKANLKTINKAIRYSTLRQTKEVFAFLSLNQRKPKSKESEE